MVIWHPVSRNIAEVISGQSICASSLLTGLPFRLSVLDAIVIHNDPVGLTLDVNAHLGSRAHRSDYFCARKRMLFPAFFWTFVSSAVTYQSVSGSCSRLSGFLPPRLTTGQCSPT
jgi:hypothetical protein